MFDKMVEDAPDKAHNLDGGSAVMFLPSSDKAGQ